ncbi:MAG: YraN family protein [Deinococcales bacterium]|nr:YraN family protein [Chitinophagaceae bacterium]
MTNHKLTGNKGEIIATNYLQDKGYAIIENNWRYKHLEVDIIASNNNRLHFVEVKTRTNTKFGLPEDSISQLKMNHLKKAAEEYLYQHAEWLKIQFDVIAITLKKDTVVEIFVIEDVFF